MLGSGEQARREHISHTNIKLVYYCSISVDAIHEIPRWFKY